MIILYKTVGNFFISTIFSQEILSLIGIIQTLVWRCLFWNKRSRSSCSSIIRNQDNRGTTCFIMERATDVFSNYIWSGQKQSVLPRNRPVLDRVFYEKRSKLVPKKRWITLLKCMFLQPTLKLLIMFLCCLFSTLLIKPGRIIYISIANMRFTEVQENKFHLTVMSW